MSENTWDQSYPSISSTTNSTQTPAVEKPDPIDDDEFENFPYRIPKDLIQVLSDSMEESIEIQSSQLSISSDTSGSDKESVISCQISLRSPLRDLLLSVSKQFEERKSVSPGSGLSDDESQEFKEDLSDSEDDKDCVSLDSKFLLLENSSSSATESVAESVIVSSNSVQNTITSDSSEYNSEEKLSDEWEQKFFSKEQNGSEYCAEYAKKWREYDSEEEWSKSGGKSDGTDSSSASEL